MSSPPPTEFVLAGAYVLPGDADARHRFSGGLAAGDIDGDGAIDLAATGGAGFGLYRGAGDGSFVALPNVGPLAAPGRPAPPAFGDIDGDGDLDLFVGGSDAHPVHIFENRLRESAAAFVDVTAAAIGTLNAADTPAATFFDYDDDGDLDLFLAHWGAERQAGEETETVWRNDGNGDYASDSEDAGVAPYLAPGGIDQSLALAFADLDSDGDGDLLVAADAGASRVLRNEGGVFSDATSEAGVDQWLAAERAAASALADFDNDGDVDWFVAGARGAAALERWQRRFPHRGQPDGDRGFGGVRGRLRCRWSPGHCPGWRRGFRLAP